MADLCLAGNTIRNIQNVCRACMQNVKEANNLSSEVTIKNEKLLLSDLLVCCASIQISETDGLSQIICHQCQNEATKSYIFGKMCETSNALLREIHLQLINTNGSRVCDKAILESSDNSNVMDDFDDDKAGSNPTSPLNNADDCKSDLEDYIFKCDKCREEFQTKRELHKHKKTHTNELNIIDPYPIEKRTCLECSKTFQHRSSLLKHIKQHNAPPKKCLYCDFQPTTPSQLAKHMEKQHANYKNFVCVTCGKTFFKITNLKLHLIVHSGIKKHICEICGMSFALGGNLSAHRRLHTGEKPFTCSLCGRGFTQQSALRSHEAGHSNKRDHICSSCGAAFSRAGALRNHQKRHLTEKPFVCAMCGQAFTFSSELKRHMTIHTGDKNYTCEVCGRSFNRSTNLKVHKRIHTGETPHVCSICGKGFIQAHCLRTHMNTHAAAVT